MKHIRSILILMMVGLLAPIVLAASDTPKVDPKILDVLEKAQAKINSSDYFSYQWRGDRKQ